MSGVCHTCKKIKQIRSRCRSQSLQLLRSFVRSIKRDQTRVLVDQVRASLDRFGLTEKGIISIQSIISNRLHNRTLGQRVQVPPPSGPALVCVACGSYPCSDTKRFLRCSYHEPWFVYICADLLGTSVASEGGSGRTTPRQQTSLRSSIKNRHLRWSFNPIQLLLYHGHVS